jgi:hypothetical protein
LKSAGFQGIFNGSSREEESTLDLRDDRRDGNWHRGGGGEWGEERAEGDDANHTNEADAFDGG